MMSSLQSIQLVVVLLLPLAGLACGPEPTFVDVHLSASHPHPDEVRAVWSARFRFARDRSLLPIARASARVEPPGLVLDASVRVDRCDAAALAEVRAAVIDLTTAHHTLVIHRVDAARAETLADQLRAALATDVTTPFERPGQVVVRAPLERVRPHLAGVPHVVEPDAATTSTTTTTLWVIDPRPALDGSAVESATADGHAVEVTLSTAGAARMRALSDDVLGQPLVLVVDGVFALAPRVLVRLTNALRLDLPPADAARAPALARAIAASNLAEPPTLVAADARCRDAAAAGADHADHIMAPR